MCIAEVTLYNVVSALNVTIVCCRRRLPVILVKSHMAETLKAATTFIEAGRIQILCLIRYADHLFFVGHSTINLSNLWLLNTT